MEKIEFYQRWSSKIIENIFIDIFSNFNNECHKNILIKLYVLKK